MENVTLKKVFFFVFTFCIPYIWYIISALFLIFIGK